MTKLIKSRKPATAKDAVIVAPVVQVEAQQVIKSPAPGRIVQTDPVRMYVASIRKDRVMLVARASETVIDAIDAVTAVSRAIRAGVDLAHTEGRESASNQIRNACSAAQAAGAHPAKVCALKWSNLARLAAAKRK